MEFLTSTGQKILFYFIIFSLLFYLLMKYLRKKGHEYFSQSYWEGRYGYFTQQMDWYTNFTQLNKDFKIDEIIKENFYSKPHQINILELGCGNSTMSFNLYNLGYKNITAIDFSYNVINQMKKTYENTSINYMQCDFNRLNEYFNQNEFNMIIEKAGLDSIATKNSPEVPEKLVNIYEKIYYVLKNNGIILSMSSKNPNFWKGNVFSKLEERKLFKCIQIKRTTFSTQHNPIQMNLYFYYLKKIEL